MLRNLLSMFLRKRIRGILKVNEDVYFVDEVTVMGFNLTNPDNYLIVQNCGDTFMVYKVVKSFCIESRNNYYARVKLYKAVPENQISIWLETFFMKPYIEPA
jgi:hypothetical protein